MTYPSAEFGRLARIKHGWAFPGDGFVDDGDAVLLSPGSFHERGGFKSRGEREKYYVGEFPPEYRLAPGSVLVCMTDLKQEAPLLGGSLRVPATGTYLHNQRLGLLKLVDPKIACLDFLYYVCNLESFRAQVRASATGTTVRHTAPERMYRCMVPAPEVVVQRRIAAALRAYDDLIAVNERRVRLLEVAVRAVFRAWFVNGRAPHAGRGRGRVRLDAVVDINPRTRVPSDRPRPFVPMSSLSTDGMAVTEWETRTGAGGAKFQNGDTLVARITPCLENGKTAYVQFLEDDGATAAGSTEFIVLRGREIGPRAVYCLARDPAFRDHAIRSMVGSDGRQRVQSDALAKFEFAVPDPATVDAFERLADPYFRQIKLVSEQSRAAALARDTLLPRLMDGTLSPPEELPELPAAK